MEVLDIRWGGLGDLLVLLPSLRLIKRLYPQAKLTLVANPEFGGLLKAVGLVDCLIPSEDRRLVSLFQVNSGASDEWLRRFDRIFIWLNKPEVEWVEIIEKRLGEKLSVVVADDSLRLPLSRYFFMMTVKTVASDTKKELSYEKMAFLPIRQEWAGEAEKLFPWNRTSPLAVIHPGSGGRQKRWELGNYLEIAKRLSREGFSGGFITGPAEKDYLSILFSFPWPPGWKWLREPPLKAVAWLLSKANLYLGNDSGITQLAGLCGCPGVALFLEENARLWAPSGKIKVIKAGSIREIKMETVWEGIKMIADSLKGAT